MKIKPFLVLFVALALLPSVGWALVDSDSDGVPDTGGPSEFSADTFTRALWHFNEGSGPTFLDSSGNGEDLSLVNNAGWVTGSSTKFGAAAANFPAGTDYAERSVALNDVIAGTHNWTVQMWIYVNTLPSDTRGLFAISETIPSVKDPFLLRTTPTNKLQVVLGRQFTFGGMGADVIDGATTIPVNEWFHVAVVRAGSTYTLFLNGIQDGTLASANAIYNITSGNPKMQINNWRGTAGISGRYDEVRISNVARSQAEILANIVIPDSCPSTPLSERPVDVNGCSQHQVDQDLDGKCDPGKTSTLCTGTDNCPTTSNPDQRNSDGDSTGDLCDPCPSDSTDVCDSSFTRSATATPTTTTTFSNSEIAVTIPTGAVPNATSVSLQRGAANLAVVTASGAGNLLFEYTLQPGSFTFAQPVTLVFTYPQGTMPEGGLQEAVLDVFKYTGGLWVPLNAIQDMTANTLTVQVSSFSTFAAIAISVSDTDGDGLPDTGAGADSYTMALWHLNQNRGTAAWDSSVNGNTGTLINTPIWTDGKFGSGLSFDIDKYVSVADSPSLDLSGTGATIEAWVYPRSFRHDGGIVSKVGPGPSGYILATYGGGGFYCIYGTGTGYDTALVSGLETNRWYHVACAYNGTDFKIYIDGVLRVSRAQAEFRNIATNDLPLRIGSNIPSPSADAIIDEVRISNVERSAAEIAAAVGAVPADNCPNTFNPTQADFDGDGTGDACDTDADNDNFADASEPSYCLYTPLNERPLDTTVAVGCSQHQVDQDLDGKCDPGKTSTLCTGTDNCPTTSNPDQADLDKDGIGDACDSDLDGDTIPNEVDNCPITSNFDQANLDGDSFGDVCDDDIDGDGVPNALDAFPRDPTETKDSDHDGIGDNADPDDDNDGVLDLADLCPLRFGTSASQGCSPMTITVRQDGTGNYQTITGALAAANPLDTILITDGATYAESVTAKSFLTIDCGVATITGGASLNSVTDVTIKNCIFQGNGAYLISTANIAFINDTFNYPYNGLYFDGIHYNTSLINSTILSASGEGIYIYYGLRGLYIIGSNISFGSSIGIYTDYESTEVLVENSNISYNSGEGIFVYDYAANYTIRNSNITNNYEGFSTSNNYYDYGITIQNSNISNNRNLGVDLGGGGSELLVENSEISGNGGGGIHTPYGGYYGGWHGARIINSNIKDNGGIGIYMPESSSISIENSQISGNSVGVDMSGYANRISGSTITGNGGADVNNGGINLIIETTPLSTIGTFAGNPAITVPTGGATVTVTAGSLQAAINAANPGDSIVVSPTPVTPSGESITINKNFISVDCGYDTLSYVTISSVRNSTLKNCYVGGSGVTMDHSYGVRVENVSVNTAYGANGFYASGPMDLLTLRNATAYNNGNGFATNDFLYKSTIENSNLSYNNGAGIYLYNNVNYIGASSKLTIRNTTIVSNNNGLDAVDSDGLLIDKINVSGNGLSIQNYNGDGLYDVQIRNSYFSGGSGIGISPYDQASVRIVNNTVNRVQNGVGLNVGYSLGSRIARNNFSENTYFGAFIGYGIANRIENNDFSSNGYPGIYSHEPFARLTNNTANSNGAGVTPYGILADGTRARLTENIACDTSGTDFAIGADAIASRNTCDTSNQPGVCFFTPCTADDDLDGVINKFDKCKGTPSLTRVDSAGCHFTSDLIGQDGGTIRSLDGNVSMIIPPGALADDTYISLVNTSGNFALADGNVIYSYQISPTNLTFLVPVMLRFNYSDTNDNCIEDSTAGSPQKTAIQDLEIDYNLTSAGKTIADCESGIYRTIGSYTLCKLSPQVISSFGTACPKPPKAPATFALGGDFLQANITHLTDFLIFGNFSAVVADSDGDGILDDQDACPTVAGTSDRQGCPAAINIDGDLHVHYHKVTGYACVDAKTGKQQKECKLPLVLGAIRDSKNETVTTANVKIYRLASLGATSFGQIKDRCQAIYDNTSLTPVNSRNLTSALTTIGVPAADSYVSIARVAISDPSTSLEYFTTVCKPNDRTDFKDSNADGIVDLAKRNLKVFKVVKPTGVQLGPSDGMTLSGSELNITFMEQAWWDETVNDFVYPYVFTSDSDWTVDVCSYVPAGYTIAGVYDELGNLITTSSCAQALVGNQTRVVAFETVKTGSPAKFDVKTDIDAAPKGKAKKKVTLTTNSEIKSKSELSKPKSTAAPKGQQITGRSIASGSPTGAATKGGAGMTGVTKQTTGKSLPTGAAISAADWASANQTILLLLVVVGLSLYTIYIIKGSRRAQDQGFRTVRSDLLAVREAVLRKPKYRFKPRRR